VRASSSLSTGCRRSDKGKAPNFSRFIFTIISSMNVRKTLANARLDWVDTVIEKLRRLLG
jgi:hypothetical protein